jgi:hypothetical protein
MGRLRVLSGREVCRILEQHGFTEVRRRGSQHRHAESDLRGHDYCPGPRPRRTRHRDPPIDLPPEPRLAHGIRVTSEQFLAVSVPRGPVAALRGRGGVAEADAEGREEAVRLFEWRIVGGVLDHDQWPSVTGARRFGHGQRRREIVASPDERRGGPSQQGLSASAPGYLSLLEHTLIPPRGLQFKPHS